MGKKVTRLYEQFQPEHYELSLDLDREAMTFTGTVTVRVRLVGYAPKEQRLSVSDGQAATVDFALTQPDIGFGRSLSDDGLLHTADIGVTPDARYLETHMQRDLIGGVHLRRDLHLDAHVRKLKLGLRIGRAADRSYAGLKAAGGDRNAIADLKRNLHAIGGTYLRRIQDLGLVVAEDSL